MTTIYLCNVIGVVLETKEVNFASSHMAMTSTHIIIANERTVYMWQYRTQAAARMGAGMMDGANLIGAGGSGASTAVRKSAGRERILDVDDQTSAPAQVSRIDAVSVSSRGLMSTLCCAHYIRLLMLVDLEKILPSIQYLALPYQIDT